MKWVASMLVLTVLALATPARAESPLEAEARAQYLAAQKHFDAARYDEALAAYERSYALTHYPALLYRLALCQDQLGRFAAALASYQQYLVDDPKSERRAGVEERIARLRELVRPAAPPAAVTPAHFEGPAPPAPSVTAAPSRTPVYKRWWLWTVIGVAAAGVAVGVGVGVSQTSSLTPASFMPNLPAQGSW